MASPRFSFRLPPVLAPSAVSAELEGLGALLDLTVSNPTACGLAYPDQAIAAALAAGARARYEPSPLGLPEARAAVTDFLRGRGVDAAPQRLCLTASTSEAYSLLFKLFCDPGEAVAIPRPSYPLLEHLAELDAVRVTPYLARYDRRWELDRDSFAAALAGGARLAIVISPNNPTGSTPSAEEWAFIRERCAAHGVALVVDEVFACYPFGEAPIPSAGGHGHVPLTFVLDGLSKSAALPQLKLGWVSVHGPARQVSETLARWEWIADTYLSVGAPVQRGARALLEAGALLREQVRERVRRNREALARWARALPEIELLNATGGWSAVLRVPFVMSDEELVLALARHASVRVQPGYFFDFEREGMLVLSLLPEPERFDEGLRRMQPVLEALFR